MEPFKCTWIIPLKSNYWSPENGRIHQVPGDTLWFGALGIRFPICQRSRLFPGISKAFSILAQGHSLVSYGASMWQKVPSPSSAGVLTSAPSGPNGVGGGVSMSAAPGHAAQCLLFPTFPSRVPDFPHSFEAMPTFYKSLQISWAVFKVHMRQFSDWIEARFHLTSGHFPFVYLSPDAFEQWPDSDEFWYLWWTSVLVWPTSLSLPLENSSQLFLWGNYPDSTACSLEGTVNQGALGRWDLRPMAGRSDSSGNLIMSRMTSDQKNNSSPTKQH